jgi:hypothetical protein
MDVVYGYEVKERGDYFVHINEEFQSFAPRVVLPGALIVNHLPFCTSSVYMHALIENSEVLGSGISATMDARSRVRRPPREGKAHALANDVGTV